MSLNITTTTGRVNWPKYPFFAKEIVEENLERLLVSLKPSLHRDDIYFRFIIY